MAFRRSVLWLALAWIVAICGCSHEATTASDGGSVGVAAAVSAGSAAVGVSAPRHLASRGPSMSNGPQVVGQGPSMSSASSSWSPLTGLPNLVGAFDAASSSKVTLVSTTHVSVWADEAGSGAAMVQATDALRPTVDASVTLGGFQTIKVDTSANQVLLSATGGVTGNAAHTIVMIGRADQIQSFRSWGGFGSNGSSSLVGFVDQGNVGGANGGGIWGGGSGKINPTMDVFDIAVVPNSITGYPLKAPDTTTFHMLTKVFDGTSVYLYSDGYFCVLNGAGNAGGPFADTYAITAGFGIMPHGNPASSYGDSFHASYIVLASGAITKVNRNLLEGWSRTHFGSGLGVPSSVPKASIHLGDSLTYGTGAVAGTSDYPTQYKALIGTSAVWNLGIPGQTVTTGLTKVVQDVAGHSTGLSPSTRLIIWYGTNDLITNQATAGYNTTVATNLATYIAAAKAQAPTGASTFVATLTHAGAAASPGVISNLSTYNAMIDALNVTIRSSASSGGYTVVDLAADARIDLVNHPECTADGVHFTPACYGYAAADMYAVTGSGAAPPLLWLLALVRRRRAANDNAYRKAA